MKYEVTAMVPTGKIWRAGVLVRHGDPADGEAMQEPIKIGDAELSNDNAVIRLHIQTLPLNWNGHAYLKPMKE